MRAFLEFFVTTYIGGLLLIICGVYFLKSTYKQDSSKFWTDPGYYKGWVAGLGFVVCGLRGIYYAFINS